VERVSQSAKAAILQRALAGFDDLFGPVAEVTNFGIYPWVDYNLLGIKNECGEAVADQALVKKYNHARKKLPTTPRGGSFHNLPYA
jgi:hypothetical protein